MATQLVTTDTAPRSVSPDAERFTLMQRQAALFASSPLIPESLRKGGQQQAMANCYIAMTIADRMGEDRMTVMQNIVIIHGTAGFKTQYMIARANASGKFKDEIDWEISGNGPTLSATAFATLAKTGKRVQITVDMNMAKAEGWTNNKKYQTMPEIMLRYRSAAFLVRLYAPEVMLGYQTAEESEDVRYGGDLPVGGEPVVVTAAMIEHQASGDADEAEASEVTGNESHGELFAFDPDQIIGFINSKARATDVHSVMASHADTIAGFSAEDQERVYAAKAARIQWIIDQAKAGAAA